MLMKKSYLSGCAVTDQIAVERVTHYHKTDSGKSWKKIDQIEQTITAEQYCNVVDAVPFFKGLGGKEIVSNGYTYYGYIPVKITSISPSRDEKNVYEFRFLRNSSY